MLLRCAAPGMLPDQVTGAALVGQPIMPPCMARSARNTAHIGQLPGGSCSGHRQASADRCALQLTQALLMMVLGLKHSVHWVAGHSTSMVVPRNVDVPAVPPAHADTQPSQCMHSTAECRLQPPPGSRPDARRVAASNGREDVTCRTGKDRMLAASSAAATEARIPGAACAPLTCPMHAGRARAAAPMRGPGVLDDPVVHPRLVRAVANHRHGVVQVVRAPHAAWLVVGAWRRARGDLFSTLALCYWPSTTRAILCSSQCIVTAPWARNWPPTSLMEAGGQQCCVQAKVLDLGQQISRVHPAPTQLWCMPAIGSV